MIWISDICANNCIAKNTCKVESKWYKKNANMFHKNVIEEMKALLLVNIYIYFFVAEISKYEKCKAIEKHAMLLSSIKIE